MRIFASLLLVCACFMSSAQNIKEHFKIDTSKRITVNLRNVSLEYAAFQYTQMTGITVIVNPTIASKISVFGSSSMSIESAYEALFASLDGLGAAAVIRDKMVIIDRKHPVLPTQPWQEPFELRHYRLKYIPADSVSRTLNSLFMPNQSKASFETYSNILIVYAPAKTQEQVRSMIFALDVNNQTYSSTRVFKLEYVYASELSVIVSNVIRLMDQGNSVTSYDYRTNSLIVTASNDSLVYTQMLIDKLDTKLVFENRTFIVKLKSARSQELANLIRSLFGVR